MPEVPTRTFTFTNTGVAEVTITSITTQPPGLYSCVFATPAVVLPGDSIQITVTCNSFPAQDADLMFNTAPCLSGHNTVKLTAYFGTADVWIPTLLADPRNDNFDIPIYFKQREGLPYGGERVFEAIIELQASVFWPRTVRSPHGAGELISSQIIRGVRQVHFKVTGDFSGEDSVLAIINGVAMLGNTMQTDIN